MENQNPENAGPDPQMRKAEAEAAAFLVRVNSDHADTSDWDALTAWLEKSEMHRQLFEEMERVWVGLDDQREALASLLAANPIGLSQIDSKVIRPNRWLSAPAIPWGLALAAGLSLVVIGGPLLWNSAFGAPQRLQTARGQTLRQSLADGTTIHLDSASAVTTRIGWRTRQVKMDQGQAAFDVAKDKSRPFVITVADEQVRVVGTEFDIRNLDGKVVVSVRRGIVEVSQIDSSAASILRLHPGEQSSHVVGSETSERSSVSPDDAFAWKEGRLICRQMRLIDLVADLNRRYPVPIVVAGPAAERRFTGVLELGDQTHLVNRLSAYLNVSAKREGGKIILR